MTTELEHIYDTEIAPLLKEVGDKCVKYGMPILAFVEWEDGMGESRFIPDSASCHFKSISMLAKCRSADDGSSFNFDQFGIGVARMVGQERCKTSMLLNPRRLESTP